MRSLSARRAWIEIVLHIGCRLRQVVALRKESVDRNSSCTSSRADRARSLSARRAWIEIAQPGAIGIAQTSLSARRAWIEMLKSKRATRRNAVALRKESVDRNLLS